MLHIVFLASAWAGTCAEREEAALAELQVHIDDAQRANINQDDLQRNVAHAAVQHILRHDRPWVRSTSMFAQIHALNGAVWGDTTFARQAAFLGESPPERTPRLRRSRFPMPLTGFLSMDGVRDRSLSTAASGQYVQWVLPNGCVQRTDLVEPYRWQRPKYPTRGTALWVASGVAAIGATAILLVANAREDALKGGEVIIENPQGHALSTNTLAVTGISFGVGALGLLGGGFAVYF